MDLNLKFSFETCSTQYATRLFILFFERKRKHPSIRQYVYHEVAWKACEWIVFCFILLRSYWKRTPFTSGCVLTCSSYTIRMQNCAVHRWSKHREHGTILSFGLTRNTSINGDHMFFANDFCDCEHPISITCRTIDCISQSYKVNSK